MFAQLLELRPSFDSVEKLIIGSRAAPPSAAGGGSASRALASGTAFDFDAASSLESAPVSGTSSCASVGLAESGMDSEAASTRMEGSDLRSAAGWQPVTAHNPTQSRPI